MAPQVHPPAFVLSERSPSQTLESKLNLEWGNAGCKQGPKANISDTHQALPVDQVFGIDTFALSLQLCPKSNYCSRFTDEFIEVQEDV